MVPPPGLLTTGVQLAGIVAANIDWLYAFTLDITYPEPCLNYSYKYYQTKSNLSCLTYFNYAYVQIAEILRETGVRSTSFFASVYKFLR